MNNNDNNINSINDDAQLALFAATNDSVEDLIYEFLKDRGAATERAYQRDLKRFFNFTGAQFGLPRKEGAKEGAYPLMGLPALLSPLEEGR